MQVMSGRVLLFEGDKTAECPSTNLNAGPDRLDQLRGCRQNFCSPFRWSGNTLHS